MELSFEKTSIAEMLFIPFSLKRKLSADAYCSILQQQNNYLKNHRNISIVGISSLRMNKPALYQDKTFHFEHLLRSKAGIYRVDSTKRTPDLGKWNIATDKEHYAELTQGSTRTWNFSNLSRPTAKSRWKNFQLLADYYAYLQNPNPSPPHHMQRSFRAPSRQISLPNQSLPRPIKRPGIASPCQHSV
jgi:hypothetical protein